MRGGSSNVFLVVIKEAWKLNMLGTRFVSRRHLKSTHEHGEWVMELKLWKNLTLEG
ncbi:hypothetical protein SLEP1_g1186 [Rubroshorea leprosula]|uniref:Uncharacterized protein n=1 Tax=Rubroshorea leprosula TaxID=152421 RepID=A0AAV5HJU1_9ROSI|nr:hypothetical protein SLEP1_g1186 [Rubroshorea leprosula]